MHCNLYYEIFCIFYFMTIGYTHPIRSEQEGALFLKKFGYLDENTDPTENVNPDEFSNALKVFQKYTGINKTGVFDDKTLLMMNTPRCGMKDNFHGSNSTRKKRYALQGSKWNKLDIKYRISKHSIHLPDHAKVKREIAKAFKVWSDVTPLTFRERQRGKFDIDIRFETGQHLCQERFDGPGGVLAHASSPDRRKEVHFDDDEIWKIEITSGGPNLFAIAAHEFGHALGLEHSEERNAMMYAYTHHNETIYELHTDDINAIQVLYGPNEHMPQPQLENKPLPDINSAPDLCQDSSIDTIARTQNGSTYIFKGEFYWEIISINRINKIADGYPRIISVDWDGLEGNLDASVTWPNGKTFFFKDKRYWCFTNKEMDYIYPKLISRGFEGVPDNLDAAFVWSGNGKTYFFKGGQYWMFDSVRDPPVSSNYPQNISSWKGLPSKVNAAFQWENRKTYFFIDDKYYRFNDKYLQVDVGNPPYPKLTSFSWFGCPDLSGNEANEDFEETQEEEQIGPPPNVCMNRYSVSIDAVIEINGEETYFFIGNYQWKIHHGEIASGYPKKISDEWNGLRGHIDASFVWPGNKVFFLKGRQYWRYTNKRLDSGYPKLISVGFEGIPDNIDAAFLWDKPGKTYFLKGDKFWAYDSRDDPPVGLNYPKPISEWSGVPNNIDGVFQKTNGGKIYFFKGSKYYRVNDFSLAVESVNPPYPRSIATYWFKC